MSADPYARMSDEAPKMDGWVVYVHEAEHRVVEGASQWTLSDNADSDYPLDWRRFDWTVRSRGKGAASSSPLLEEVLICARRALYAAGGGAIITLDRDRREVAREVVVACEHTDLMYDFMGGDICRDCGAHF